MAELWQLRRLSTNENLNEPQRLPKNWGSIFGMEGVKDQLGDLSWINRPDEGWFLVGDDGASDVEPTLAEKEWTKAKGLLAASDWAVLPDVPMTAGKRDEWEAYRAALRDIREQEGFPETIVWPGEPA